MRRRRRASVRLQAIGSAEPAPPGARGPQVDSRPPAPDPRRSSGGARRSGDDPRRRLRRVDELPGRARAFLVVALLVIVGFAAWVTVRLLAVDGEALAILLIALSYIGAVAVAVAVVTLTRLAFSVSALPFLLGCGARRLLTRRRG